MAPLVPTSSPQTVSNFFPGCQRDTYPVSVTAGVTYIFSTCEASNLGTVLQSAITIQDSTGSNCIFGNCPAGQDGAFYQYTAVANEVILVNIGNYNGPCTQGTYHLVYYLQSPCAGLTLPNCKFFFEGFTPANPPVFDLGNDPTLGDRDFGTCIDVMTSPTTSAPVVAGNSNGWKVITASGLTTGVGSSNQFKAYNNNGHCLQIHTETFNAKDGLTQAQVFQANKGICVKVDIPNYSLAGGQNVNNGGADSCIIFGTR
jgi:hypothetical protein